MVARFVLALITVLLVLPGAAFAQEPGVHVDPDSPSGKEYAIPLSQARGDAAPSSTAAPVEQGSSTGGKTKKTKEKTAVLFGAGVTPESSTSGASESAALAATTAAGASDDGISPWLLGLGVLVAGLGIGFLIRAVRRATSR